MERTQYVHTADAQTEELKGPPPTGIVLTKGSVHITASRGYVDYVLHNHTAQQFLNWVKDTYVSDETYFSSLNHSPELNVPGSYRGEWTTKMRVI